MKSWYVFLGVLQSVDIVKYTDEEYEKYLTDPVGINSIATLFVWCKLLISSAFVVIWPVWSILNKYVLINTREVWILYFWVHIDSVVVTILPLKTY